MDEQVDLAEEHRKYVLEVHPRLGSLSYYELLGVARDADKKAIKRAYFHLAAIVHPDRHYGKKLGSFKPKMEALFARITEAYETLSFPDKRAAYDRTLPATSAASVAAPAVPIDKEAAAKKQAALDALKAKFLEGKAKAKIHLDAAARARAAGDFVAAAEAYKLALALAPNDAEIKTAYGEVMAAAASKLCDSYKRQAILEERYGHWREAAVSWKRVVDARPDDAEARQRLAAALAKAGG